MRAEIVVEPALDSPGDWYWAVKVDGGIYADGTAENRMVAQSPPLPKVTCDHQGGHEYHCEVCKPGVAQPLTCANCGEVSTTPGQFTPDGRWLCTEACRKELVEIQRRRS